MAAKDAVPACPPASAAAALPAYPAANSRGAGLCRRAKAASCQMAPPSGFSV